MRKNKIQIVALLSLILLFSNSCMKEGDVGPAGIDGLSGTKILSGQTEPSAELGINGDFYFHLSTKDLYGPKTNDGWGDPINLVGDRGVTGATGPAGPAGQTGQAGSKIWSGTSTPASSSGAIGDYFLNTNTTELYGPKTNAGWGTPINLKGLNGTKILNGTAVPTSTVGALGDYYFKTNTGHLYGPKTNAGWGTPLLLIGKNGSNGQDGQDGEDGEDGSDGKDGATIISGTTVPSSTAGKIGDFYYRLNTGDFYGPKISSGWGTPTNLKGSNGKDGLPGSQILSGTTVPGMELGRIGDFYFRTNTSDFYGPKTAVSWGTPVNLRGATGASGATGQQGTPGSKILNGSGTPTPSTGVNGDYYINIINADLYGPKTNNAWGSPMMNLRGPAGPLTEVIYSKWLPLMGVSQNRNSGDITGYIVVPEFKEFPDLYHTASIVVYLREDTRGKGFFISQLNCVSRMYDWVNINHWMYQDDATIQVEIVNTAFDIGPDQISENFTFRYVIIPGNTAAQGRLNRQAIDYHEIKSKYNIPD